MRAHSSKRPVLVATTFLNSQGGRLRKLRLSVQYPKVKNYPEPLYLEACHGIGRRVEWGWGE